MPRAEANARHSTVWGSWSWGAAWGTGLTGVSSGPAAPREQSCSAPALLTCQAGHFPSAGKDAGSGPAHSPLVHSTLPPPQLKKTKPWKEMAQCLQDGHGEGGAPQLKLLLQTHNGRQSERGCGSNPQPATTPPQRPWANLFLSYTFHL